jgi:hypothetical protein
MRPFFEAFLLIILLIPVFHVVTGGAGARLIMGFREEGLC